MGDDDYNGGGGGDAFYGLIDSAPEIMRPRRKSIPLVSDLVSHKRERKRERDTKINYP